MSIAQSQAYSAPFDAIAARYDETFTHSKIGQAQRTSVWKELRKAFLPGQRVLEIGCGTGIDACFLAQSGVRVVACDSSPQMIDVTTRRIHENGLQRLIEPRLLAAENLASLLPNERFDGAFSNFGVLNCVPDLSGLSRTLAALLKPGSPAVLCWMGPFCAWETAWYMAHGNREKAFRRLSRDALSARIAEGTFVNITYPSFAELSRIFVREFRLKSMKGIGVAVPPSYLEPWAQRHPHLFKLSERADSLLGRCPGVRSLGDHVLVRLERITGSAGSAER